MVRVGCLMKTAIAKFFAAAAVICLFAGCAGPKLKSDPSGFLSDYRRLKPVETGGWKYVNVPVLAGYNRFRIGSVEILAKKADGGSWTAEQQKSMSDYLRASIVRALNSNYAVVDSASAETGEIRVAITDAVKDGVRLGINIEGEIRGTESVEQAAAVMLAGSEGIYLKDWWEDANGRRILDTWTHRLRQVIDSAHAW